MTTHHGGRYLDSPDLPLSAAGPPDYYVIHAWANPFSLLVDALSAYLHTNPGLQQPGEVRLWLDLFALSAHEAHPPSPLSGEDLEAAVAGALTDPISASKAVLLVLDPASTPLRRLWCLFELDAAVHLKGPDGLLILTTRGASGVKGPDGLEVLTAGGASGMLDVGRLGHEVDAEAAGCSQASERAYLQALIDQQHGGSAALSSRLRLFFMLQPLDYRAELQTAQVRGRGGTCKYVL